MSSRRRLGPTEVLSKALGRAAATHVPGAATAFARLVGADATEAELPLDAYPSVLAFFTRRLEPGARPVDPGSDVLCSPVDGSLLATGPVGDGRLIQSKGRRYGLAALLEDDALANSLLGGAYASIYLSPKDYHRIHAPSDGRIARARVIPGALLPVNALGTRFMRDLLPRNRRVVVELVTERFGRVAVVMVGATNVGAIRATFDADLTRRFDVPREARYSPPIPVVRGDEMGIFELGSTVVVVTERPVRLIDRKPGDPVRMGRCLGRVSPSSSR